MAAVLALCCSSILKLAKTPLDDDGMGGGMLQGLVGMEGGEAGADFADGDFEEGLADLVDLVEARGMSMGVIANATVTFGAWAVLLMWFRQLRLLMIVSSDMAPLIRMMGGMLKARRTLATYYLPLTTTYLTTYYLLPTTHYLPLTTYYSYLLLTTH